MFFLFQLYIYYNVVNKPNTPGFFYPSIIDLNEPVVDDNIQLNMQRLLNSQAALRIET